MRPPPLNRPYSPQQEPSAGAPLTVDGADRPVSKDDVSIVNVARMIEDQAAEEAAAAVLPDYSRRAFEG